MKRTRSHQVSFRLNDKEYALLQRKLAASGMSLTEFFIETISKGKEIVISDFVPLLSELKRQGVNLNQLTRRINQFSPTTEREIITPLQQCQNMNTKEVAQALSCSLPTARRIMQREDFPLIRVGKNMKVNAEAFDEWTKCRRA